MPRLALLLLIALSSSAQEIGWRRTFVSDPTRFTGREPRQVLVQFWYPAVANTGAPMTQGDYVTELPKTLARREIHEYAKGKYGMTSLLDAQPVASRRNATQKSGNFPVVIYAGGYGNPPDENTVLFEALAKRGYVVVVVMNDATLDAAGLETHTRDMELALSVACHPSRSEGAPSHAPCSSHIGRGSRAPARDDTRVVAIGFSWGGAAAIYAAMRNPNISAVVALDSSAIAKRFVPVITSMPFFSPDRFTAALLDIHRADPNSVTYELLDQLRYSDRTSVELENLNHIDFNSYAALYGAPAGAAYNTILQHVLQFLDGKVITPSRYRAALPAPPDLAKVIKTEGLAAAKRAFLETRRRDPQAAAISEDAINRLGASLLSAGEKEAAKEVWLWNVEAHPQSANAIDSLAEALMALGDEACSVAAYKRVLALLPGEKNEVLATTLRRIANEALAKLPRETAPCTLPALH